MGHADYYKHGDRNAICDECSGKFKLSQLRKRWDGCLTCSECWDHEPESNYWVHRSERERIVDGRPEQADQDAPTVTKDDL